KDNILPIQESGQLKFASDGQELFPGFNLWFTYGHTGAMMLPHITHQDKTLVFMADLMPSVAHIPLPWVMAYDTQPLETLREKASFLQTAADKNYVLFFEHDAINECCTVKQTEKGIQREASGLLIDFFS
ncbi:MAG: MBL fold metallo-hydrolase, partial [Bacteroidia bacterium]